MASTGAFRAVCLQRVAGNISRYPSDANHSQATDHKAKKNRPKAACVGCRVLYCPSLYIRLPQAHFPPRGKWREQAVVLRDGLSLTQEMQRLNVARTRRGTGAIAALRPPTVQAQVLNGVAKAGETFFLRSCQEPRSGSAPRRGSVGSRKSRFRYGALAPAPAPWLILFSLSIVDDAPHVVAALKPSLSLDAVLCTDSRTVVVR
jgi:hypothetical protein